MLKKFTEAAFESEVLNCAKPVLVKFWTEGCYPCKLLTPVITEFAEKYADKIIVGEVNAQENMGLAMKYNISGVPTTIVFQDGKAASKITGYVDLEELEEALAEFIG